MQYAGGRSIKASARAVAVALALVAFAGCGSSDSSSSTGAGTAAITNADGPRVAAFGFAGSSYWAASMAEIERTIETAGGSVQEFQTPFDPAKQFRQVQDATASGQYDAFILSALDGVSLAPAIRQAIDKGIKVVGISSAVGAAQDTTEVQIEGMSGAILDPPVQRGQWLGGLVVRACEGISSCTVVLEPGSLQIPIEQLFMSEAEKVIRSSGRDIEVVAKVASGRQAGPAQRATSDVLRAHPDVNVIAADSDQAIVGALIALRQAGKSVGTDDGEVRLVGLGSSEPGVRGVRDGDWYGSVLSLPGDEGRLGAEAIVKAVSGRLDAPVQMSAAEESGISPELTKEELPEDFRAQWAG